MTDAATIALYLDKTKGAIQHSYIMAREDYEHLYPADQEGMETQEEFDKFFAAFEDYRSACIALTNRLTKKKV